MSIETPVLIAIVAALGTALGAILSHINNMRKEQSSRTSSLEDNQREFIEVLSTELHDTRAEMRQVSRALAECKRDIIILLEQLAGVVKEHIDDIEEHIED